MREHGVATGRALQQLVHAGRRRAPACSCRGAAAAAAAAPDPPRAGGRAEVDARDGPQGTEQIGRVLLPPEHRCSLSPSTSRQRPARRCTGSGEEKRKKRPDGVPGGRRRRPDPGVAAWRSWKPEAEAGRRTRKQRWRPSRGDRTRARQLAGPGVRWRRRAPDRRAGFRVCDGVGFLVLVGFEPGARQRQRAGARRSAPRRFNALKLRVDVRSIEI